MSKHFERRKRGNTFPPMLSTRKWRRDYYSLSMKYKDDFPKLHSLFIKIQTKRGVKMTLGMAKVYLQSVKDNKMENKIVIVENFLIYLISINLLCNSNLFIKYIEVLRKEKHLVSSQCILRKIRNLNIHRPSFKLIAMIITTYCSLGIKNVKNKDLARECASYAVEFYDIMKKRYKYKINTYLLNSLLNALRKIGMKKKFWDIVQITTDEKCPMFDSFTYGCLLEQSIKEENLQKFGNIYKEFKGRKFKKDKSTSYIKSLHDKIKKLETIESEKQKKWLDSGKGRWSELFFYGTVL